MPVADGRPRVALGQFGRPTDAMLTFARQLGLPGVSLNTPALPGERRWEREDLERLRERAEAFRLRLESIENVPYGFYERAMLGQPGADEDLEHMAATVRAVGEAGIGVLGLNFMPGSVWRTSIDGRGRGGARVSAFDARLLERPGALERAYVARRERRLDDPWVRGGAHANGVRVDEDALWGHYTTFITSLAPVAEAAGVRIALHPDDPPVPELAGVARILRDVDALERAIEIAGSPAVGLNLCLGTISAAGGEAAVLDAIRRFGPAGRIVYVHFRDVRGTVPAFEECFLGEGNYRPLEVMRTLVDSGFDGFVLDDHVPRLTDDTDYAHRGRAHAVGYLQALVEATT